MGTAQDTTLNVVQVMHYNLTYEVVSGALNVIGTLPAGAVILSVTGAVNTVFNAGTSNQLNIGTAADVDAYAAVGDIAVNALGVTRYEGKGAKVTADTEVIVEYTQAGTAATTGQADIFIEYVVVR